MITLIDIPTKEWNEIYQWLLTQGWSIEYQYDQVDAGTDYDLIVLNHEEKILKMAWSNWEEGEIQGEDQVIDDIIAHVKFPYKIGDPVNLKEEVVALYYKPKSGPTRRRRRIKKNERGPTKRLRR